MAVDVVLPRVGIPICILGDWGTCVFFMVFLSPNCSFSISCFSCVRACARSGTVVIRSSRLPGLIGLHDGVDRAYKVFRKQLLVASELCAPKHAGM